MLCGNLLLLLVVACWLLVVLSIALRIICCLIMFYVGGGGGVVFFILIHIYFLFLLFFFVSFSFFHQPVFVWKNFSLKWTDWPPGTHKTTTTTRNIIMKQGKCFNVVEYFNSRNIYFEDISLRQHVTKIVSENIVCYFT